ncbi:hypothetical protein C5Y96_13005 [Blastopirellula marina]|uniref:STAS domain-containing protein n=1 Tax=Blastopirellula marina TaxID=124 RepID=A0A2S8FGH6_9BACT|nr:MULTISPECIES: hypothetical protein [Pirellulaceae]PQO31257.1 hypothetical protein C5Y96_13005 [Blastopirellula marina]RCS51651.1 hypothetical protein DTL36_13015 [Bremerella cremea]
MTPFTIIFDELPEYLQYALSGDHSDQDWLDLLHRMAADIKRTGKSKIFVDASQVTMSTSVMLRYRIGVLTGELFGATTRIATLSRADDADQLWETVATNRGAIVRSGRDREKLLGWLNEVA